jgi:hypothetical protein
MLGQRPGHRKRRLDNAAWREVRKGAQISQGCIKLGSANAGAGAAGAADRDKAPKILIASPPQALSMTSHP